MAENAKVCEAPERQGRMKWQQVDIKPVTIEDVPTVSYPIDEVITKKDAGHQQASLARQLANDEPKCGNCAKWSSPAGEPVGACMHPRAFALDLPVHTTDLSVCSAWTQK
jgi:hypothetical protein